MNPNLVEDYIESKRTIEFTSLVEASISTASYVRIRQKSKSGASISIREASTGMSYELSFNQWSELLEGSSSIYCTKDQKENLYYIELIEYYPNFQDVVDSSRNQGEQTIEDASEGFHYFPDSKQIKYVTKNKNLVSITDQGIQSKRLQKIENKKKKPLIQAPLWQANTAYLIKSIVRHSNGQLMHAKAAGTSGATEPTWSFITNMTETAGLIWEAMGQVSKVNTDGYAIPTVTVGDSAPSNSVAKALRNTAIAGKLVAVTITTAGSGYVDGTYTNVPLTMTSGTATEIVALSVTIASGAVTAFKFAAEGVGANAVIGNTATIHNSLLGGSGSGLVLTVKTVMQIPDASFVNHSSLQGIICSSDGTNQVYFMNSGSSFVSPTSSWGYHILDFMTDDPSPSFLIYDAKSYLWMDVYVDDYLVSEAYPIFTTTTNRYLTIDFNGERKLRKYHIVLHNSRSFTNIYIQPNSVIYPVYDDLKACYFGDSFHGYVPSSGVTGPSPRILAHRIFEDIGIFNVRCYGIGGTGYIQGKNLDDNNTSTETYNTKEVLRANNFTGFKDAIAIVIAQGFNDLNNDRTQCLSNALQSWQLARENFPEAIIIIFGPWPTSSGPSQSILDFDTQLYNLFLSWGDEFSAYHSVAAPKEGGNSWTFGTGYQGNVVSDSNGDLYIDNAGTHPTYYGAEYFIGRMSKLIHEDLLKYGL